MEELSIPEAKFNLTQRSCIIHADKVQFRTYDCMEQHDVSGIDATSVL